MSKEPKKWIRGRAAILLCTMACVSGATDSKPPKEMVEEAVTLSGRRVTLYKDGSWEYEKTREPNEVLFRSVPWGVTADEVKRRMKSTPSVDSDDLISFADTVGNLNARCVFILAGGRFVRGRYQFAEKHVNENLFLDDFAKVETLLTKKYGKPSTSDKIWKDNLYKDNPSRWGMAISTGRLMFYSEWKVGKVAIIHTLQGDNFELDHGMEYTQRDMQVLERSIREQKDQGKL